MLVLSLSNMKKILLTILFTLVLSGGASAEKIYFDCKTSNGNPNFINYDINNKIFSIVSIKSENPIKTTEWNLTINKVEKDKLTMRSDTFQKYSTKLLTYNALHMMKKFNRNEDEAFKSTNDAHKMMSKYYKEDGQEFFAKTGEYLSGTPLQGDLDVCSTIIKNTQ